MMNYSAIIFDLDGTILNTLEDLHDSVDYALASGGYPLRTLAETRRFVGNGIRRLIERSLPAEASEAEIEKTLGIFRGHYEKNMMNNTRPYDGIVDFIGKVRAEGYRTAVVSNKIEPAVIVLCNDMFPNLFDVIIGQTDDRKIKPAPDGILYAMEKLGTTADNTVFTGDSEVDVQTAKNAGLKCIGVTWGFRDRDELITAGADFIIDSPNEYLKII